MEGVPRRVAADGVRRFCKAGGERESGVAVEPRRIAATKLPDSGECTAAREATSAAGAQSWSLEKREKIHLLFRLFHFIYHEYMLSVPSIVFFIIFSKKREDVIHSKSE